MAQLDLFEETGVEVPAPPPPSKVTVRLGNHIAKPRLLTKRRQALKELMALLQELEGHSIYIGHCDGSHGHFWLEHLKLGPLRVEHFGQKDCPGVVVLRGSRGAQVRIFTQLVYNFRRQDYTDYTLWLLDFWNGFGEYPIEKYKRPGFDALTITRFNKKGAVLPDRS